MQAGISTASFYPMLLEDTIMDLGENGIKKIEIFLNTFTEMAQPFLGEMSRIIKSQEQDVVAFHPFTSGFEPFMLFGEYKRRVDDAIEMHKKYFEAMNMLECNLFVFHGDRRESTLQNEIYFERFARLRDVGKQFGVTVAQENVERCKSSSLSFLNDMIRYLDNDVALVFDNKQATRSGITYAEFISAVGSNIAHVHLSDSTKECDCVTIGNGNVNISDLIRSLSITGFSGCIVVELYSQLLDSLDDVYKSYNNIFVQI